MAHGDHGSSGCCNGPTTSIDKVLEGEGDLEASARNHTVIALTAGATVTLPDDLESGDEITIVAPNGAVNLAVPEGSGITLPTGLTSVAGGTALGLVFVAAECGCGGRFFPICCDLPL